MQHKGHPAPRSVRRGWNPGPACTSRRSAGASSEVSTPAAGTCCYPGTCRTPGWKQTLTGDGGGSMPTSTTTPSARRLHASSSGTAGRRDAPCGGYFSTGRGLRRRARTVRGRSIPRSPASVPVRQGGTWCAQSCGLRGMPSAQTSPAIAALAVTRPVPVRQARHRHGRCPSGRLFPSGQYTNYKFPGA